MKASTIEKNSHKVVILNVLLGDDEEDSVRFLHTPAVSSFTQAIIINQNLHQRFSKCGPSVSQLLLRSLLTCRYTPCISRLHESGEEGQQERIDFKNKSPTYLENEKY